MKVSLRISLFFSLISCIAMACVAQTNESEIEKREAAAGFLLPQAMALSVLRLECRQWLASTDDDVDKVAQIWWERNRGDLDAALWISTQAVQRYRSTLSSGQASNAERQMVAAVSNANLDILRSVFQRKVPTPDSCQRALQRYKTALLDVANLKSTRGYEQFAEFGETLKRAKADPMYHSREEMYRTLEAQVGIAKTPLITLDAIEAARETRDPAVQIQGFKSLAQRNDAQAAQALGVIYLRGQIVPRNYPAASAWFYNAWAMGEPEGLNALGVMARDGLGMSIDNKLAIAAFAVVRKNTSPGSTGASQRAKANYSSLEKQLSEKDLADAGCMTWASLNNRFRTLTNSVPEVVLHEAPKASNDSFLASGIFTSLGTLSCQ